MRWGLIVGIPVVGALVAVTAALGTPPITTVQPRATTTPVAARAATASKAPSPTAALHATERTAPAPTAAQEAVAACLVRNGLSASVALADAMNPAAHGAGLDGCRANPDYTTPPPPTAQGGSLTVTANPPTSQASATGGGSLTVTVGPQTATANTPRWTWEQAKQGPGNPWFVKAMECAEYGLC